MKYWYVLLCTFFVFPITGMNKYNNPREYYAACRDIDETALMQVSNAMRRIRSAKATENSEKIASDISLLKSELDLSRQHIEEKREQVLHEFKNYYEINNEDWKWIRHTTHQLYSLNEKNKSTFYPNQAHDQEVPESAALLLWKELTLCGVNPSRVHFSSALRDPFLYGVKVGIKKSVIAVNPLRWNQASIKLKKFASICAVEELVEELSVLPIVLKYCWSGVIRPEMRQDRAGLTKARETTRIISMQSACLRNKKTAFLMKKYADNVINPCFTSGDYAFISSVVWRWKALTEAQRVYAGMYLKAPIIYRNLLSLGLSENISEKAQDERAEDTGYLAMPHNSRAESLSEEDISGEESGYTDYID